MAEYIEREAAEDVIIGRVEWFDWEVKASIRAIPAADVVPVRHGRWIQSTDADDGHCSICNCDMPMFKEDWEWRYCNTPYCPNCGALMDKDGDA